jgi:hypothetical protein
MNLPTNPQSLWNQATLRENLLLPTNQVILSRRIPQLLRFSDYLGGRGIDSTTMILDEMSENKMRNIQDKTLITSSRTLNLLFETDLRFTSI